MIRLQRYLENTDCVYDAMREICQEIDDYNLECIISFRNLSKINAKYEQGEWTDGGSQLYQDEDECRFKILNYLIREKKFCLVQNAINEGKEKSKSKQDKNFYELMEKQLSLVYTPMKSAYKKK